MAFRAEPIFATDLPAETQDVVRKMFGQLPIVFALRAGGELRIPVAEVDATGAYILDMEVDGRTLVFKARKKS
jgi:hypothetical protein